LRCRGRRFLESCFLRRSFTRQRTAPLKMFEEDEVSGFDLLVEDSGTCPVFALPAQWSAEERQVGYLSVTILQPQEGSEAASHANGIPLVTFHDIGLSASTCFASFFAYAHAGGGCPEVYAASAHYHITAPGCVPDAPTLPASFPYQSFADLGTMVNAALGELDVRRAIGLGAGAGSSVIAHAARAEPRLWAGLVLVSPLFNASGYLERGLAVADGAYMRGLGLGGRVKERFLRRWLSPQAIDERDELVSVLDASVDRLNASNVARFMQAEAWRDGLVEHLREIKAKVMLVTGRESTLRQDTADYFSQLDPSRTSWLDVPESGGLVHEEMPERIGTGLSLFLQGFGTYDRAPTLAFKYN
jgi:pimeloyl-ACP methyl ester carboxylesterase